MIYKPEIRRKISAKRKQLSSEVIELSAQQVAAQLIYLAELIDSQHIAYYIAHDGEVDPAPIVKYERHQHKNFYLPVIDPNDNKQMDFYHYKNNDPLEKNHFGIEEPKTNSQNPTNIKQLDVVLVPLVGFDKNCNRLGRGAGYYDHTFAFKNENRQQTKPLLIGLAYEFQKIAEFAPNDWDVPLDMVVTEKEIYNKKRNNQ